MTQETPGQESEAHAAKAKAWAELDAAEAAGKPAVLEAPAATTNESKPEQEAAAATAATATPEADPYEGVPSIVRDEIAGLKSMLSRATATIDATNGRIGGLNRDLTQLREAAKKAKDSGGDAPSAAAIKAATEGGAGAMAKLKEDYPEFGTALEAALSEKLGAVQDQLAKAKPAGTEGEGGLTKADFEKFKREHVVETKHPGWTEHVKTPAFAGWLQKQPREVQLLGGSDDPRDAIRLLDLEREARNPAPVKNEPTRDSQRLDAAASIPTGRGAPTMRAKPIEKMNKAEFWAYLDEQDRLKQPA